MRGHLEKRSKKTWRAKVYLGRDADGRKHYKMRTIHGTKGQAEHLLNEMLVEAGHGSLVPEDGTVADLAQRWIAVASATLSPTTLAEYRRLLDRRILPRFGAKKVRDLRSAELDQFYAELQRPAAKSSRPLSPQSVRHIHALIRRLLNQAVKWGWIANNPAARSSPPRHLRQDLNLPPADAVNRILAAAESGDPELALFLRLSVVTGARRGELCALRWSDIDAKAGTLRVSRSIVGVRNDQLIEKDTKTHSSRQLALDVSTLNRLAEHRLLSLEQADACGGKFNNDGFVFSQEPDGHLPWRPNRVTLAFGRLCRSIDLPGVRLHDLRHFAATRMLAGGVPVKTVATRLGHANAATTLNVYAHTLEESDEGAAYILAGLLDDKRNASPGRRRMVGTPRRTLRPEISGASVFRD